MSISPTQKVAKMLRSVEAKCKKAVKPELYTKTKTLKDARRLLARSYNEYEDKLRSRTEELKLGKKSGRRFEAMSGARAFAGELRHSDIPARIKFARLVVDEIHALETNDPELEFMFITLLADEGIMSDRRPVAYLDCLLDKARRALMTLGVDGIANLEISPLMNYPGKGRGRSLLAHIHALIWYNPNLQAAPSPLMDLTPSRGFRAWTCKFGADPIVVTRITPERGTAAFWAAYMFKAAHDAKNLVRKEDNNDFYRYRMMKTTTGYRPELAMRVHELSSQLPLTSLCLGTKSGATILRRCRKQVKRWAKTRSYPNSAPQGEFNEKKFWKRTHRRRKKAYLPFVIMGSTID